jgi:hypothetical protein
MLPALAETANPSLGHSREIGGIAVGLLSGHEIGGSAFQAAIVLSEIRKDYSAQLARLA